ncbi:MAG: hypothetical protein JWN87_260 [Frankiales bacterium]|nr:hypothetical protein [Frankiales bacterium]MCW2585670.1 hypothetical protein [Frankiales bacterium]
MSPTRRVARPLLASIFIAGGIDSLRQPGPRIEMARKAGLSNPETAVRVNAVADIVAGLALATNRVPRLASLVLAASTVPTTLVRHPFWEEKDKAARQQQQVHFFKNLGLLGGLLLSAADTGGRESIPHAAGRVGREARQEAVQVTHKARKDAAHAAHQARKDAAKAAHKARVEAAALAYKARAEAEQAAEQAAKRAAKVQKQTRKKAQRHGGRVTDKAAQLSKALPHVA